MDNKRQLTEHESEKDYDALVDSIENVYEEGRRQAITRINNLIVKTNWEIGKYIVEYEQAGHEKADYGSNTLKSLSKDLTRRCGKGFSRSNISRMRQLYLAYPKCATLSQKLSWSHYVELLKIDDPLEISFFFWN